MSHDKNERLLQRRSYFMCWELKFNLQERERESTGNSIYGWEEGGREKADDILLVGDSESKGKF